MSIPEDKDRFSVCGHSVPLDNLALYSEEKRIFISCSGRRKIIIVLKDNESRKDRKVECTFQQFYDLLQACLNTHPAEESKGR